MEIKRIQQINTMYTLQKQLDSHYHKHLFDQCDFFVLSLGQLYAKKLDDAIMLPLLLFSIFLFLGCSSMQSNLVCNIVKLEDLAASTNAISLTKVGLLFHCCVCEVRHVDVFHCFYFQCERKVLVQVGTSTGTTSTFRTRSTFNGK